MSKAALPVDLRPDHWHIVQDIIRQHVPERGVVAFGSRATWTAKEYSDLDLAILGDEPLPIRTIAALIEDLSESDLPFKVDIVDWASTDERFRKRILRHGVRVLAPMGCSGSQYEDDENIRMVDRGNIGADPVIDITTSQRQTLVTLLEHHIPNTEAWAYRSRVEWTARPHFDLDLVVFTTPAQQHAVSDLREAFKESNLPFRVDLCVWDDVPGSFRKQIEREHVVLCKPFCGAVLKLGECIIMNEETYSPKEGWSFINYLDTGNITDNQIDTIQRLNLDTDKLPSRARRKVRAGDIVFSTVRPNKRHFGLLYEIPENFLASTGFAVFRARENIADTGFIYWFLTQDRIINNLNTIAEHSTSAYPSIRPVDISGLKIKLPPLPEQRAIANILGLLDDKIELNRRMNRTLEAMARAIFKDWFVDFGPVRAKMAGRAPYLATEIWELFPDMLDGEGMPFGWEVSAIGREVNTVGGATPSTKEPSFWEGGEFHWATPKDLSKLSSPVLLETNRKITEAGLRKISSGLLPVGTLLMSSRAPIGYLAISEVPAAVNQGFIAMVCEKRIPNVFVLFWCYENLDHITGIAGGSTFAEISKKVFRSIPVVVPSQWIVEEFERLVRPLYSRIVTNMKEAESLAKTRDYLLPKLMSGEIRLQDAERAVKAVA